MNVAWSLRLSCCHLLNSESILSCLPRLTKNFSSAPAIQQHFQYFQKKQNTMMLLGCPSQWDLSFIPASFLRKKKAFLLSFLSEEITKIFSQKKNPSNFQCHLINSSISRWLQSKCWLPCTNKPGIAPIGASFESTVLQSGGTQLWDICLHNHI